MISTRRNHTHCQVAQKADTQTKTCQRVWLPQHTDKLRRIKHENTTHGIVHAGFIGFQAFVAREKNRCKLIENRFELPHDTIPSNVVPHAKKPMCNKIRNKDKWKIKGRKRFIEIKTDVNL